MRFSTLSLILGGVLVVSASVSQAGEISLVEIHGPLTHSTYQLRWKGDLSTCEASQSRSATTNWKSVSVATCQRVLGFLSKYRSDLDRDTSSAPPVVRTPKARIGRLSFLGQQWTVNLNTAKTCDATSSHCQEPELSYSSQLALELRTAITAALGRLK